MYARIVNVQVRLDKLAEATRLFEESVIPAARQQPGFQSIMLLTDPKTGKGIAIGVWATEADMLANEANGYYQAQLAKFGSLFAAPPVRETFEVGAHS